MRFHGKYWGAIAGIILGLLVPSLLVAFGVAGAPFEADLVVKDLTFQAACALGILVWAIAWWIAGVLPDYITALIMAILFILICGVPIDDAFGSFSGSVWWLLVGAFGLGYAMQKCGLMERMSLAILGIFPRTFKAQVAGFIAAGTLIGPFIPSLAAKASMLAPLSMSVSDSLGFERKGKEATGLFLAMFLGIRNVGPAVISSSAIGYALIGTLPPDVAANFDMLRWMTCMLPWLIVVTVLTYVSIVLIFGSGRSNARSVEVADTREPMSVHEKKMTAIMICCIALWMTQPLHGIPAYIVALAAFVATVACGIFTKDDLKQGINWSSLLFLGVVFGLADDFGFLGINTWIVGLCEPAMSQLAQNPYLLVFGIALLTIAVRFVIISEIPYLNIFMAFMVPLAMAFGVNPWVVGVSAYAAVGPFFARYENPVYLIADSATGSEMAAQSKVSAYSVVYSCIIIVALMASVPYWQFLGIL